MNSQSNIYTITNVSYVPIQRKGTAKLTSPCSSNMRLIWCVNEYPMDVLGMPGSPYTIQVEYTIFDKNLPNPTKSNYNSIQGSFVYQIASGTLPKYSELGIPYGTYTSMGMSCDADFNKKIMIILTETSLKLIVGH